MKGISLSIFFLFLLSFMSCTKDEINNTDSEIEKLNTPAVPDSMLSDILLKPSLKVLFIGNSYTEDYTSLLYVLTSYTTDTLPDISIYRLVRGAASFDTWYNCFNAKDSAQYSFSPVMDNLKLSLPSGTSPKCNSSLLLTALSYQWDIIFIQQCSQYANNYSSWFSDTEAGNLYPYLKEIRTRQPNAVIGFVLVHSYKDDYKYNTEGSHYLRWQNIASSTSSLMTNHKVFQLLLPCGTAIENLRQNGHNNNYDLTRDGLHLSYGLARYTAAFCIFNKLIRPRLSNQSSLYRVFYKCTDEEKAASTYPTIDVDSSNYAIAQKAAMDACNSPFCISGE